MRHAEWLIHRGISLPRAPTLATTTAVHTRARHPESVTHVLGLKCHPCTLSHRPRLRASWCFCTLSVRFAAPRHFASG